MADLTQDQLQFLATQRIPTSQLFDASGMRKRDYSAAMDAAGAYFAFGVTPCAAGGHQLRTKAGHCVQCDTSKIAFALRHSAEASVYIAESKAASLVKVGVTGDLSDRLYKLREYQYGGADDWVLLCSAFVKEAGRLEFSVQDRLAAHRVPGSYVRAGRVQSCYELFACDSSEAVQALAKLAPAGAVVWP